MLRPEPQPVKRADLHRGGGKPERVRGIVGLWRHALRGEPEPHVIVSQGDPMSPKSTNAGALALLATPIVVIAAVLIQPTLSGDASTQVTALTSHHRAMITGMTLSIIALVMLIAGTLWLALALAPRAPRLAIAGAVLGVFGALVVLFENSVAAAAPAIASGLGHAQATVMLESVHSGAVAAVEPLALLGDIGIALLGLAALKAGAPRWAAAAIAVGAIGEGTGFATSTKALVVISFAILFAGLLPAVRALRTATSPHPAAKPAPTITVS